MNRSFFCFTFFICSVITGNAQVSFGVKGGLNFNTIKEVSHVKNDPAFNLEPMKYKTSFGYHLGTYLSLPINKRSSIYLELQYTLRGAKIDNIRHNLNYVELPVLFSYSLFEKFAIEGGPGISYKISAIARKDDQKNNIDILYDENIDIGIYSGVRVPVNNKISIIGRYYFGLLKLFEITYINGPSPTDGSGDIKYYNRTIQFGLTYKIK